MPRDNDTVTSYILFFVPILYVCCFGHQSSKKALTSADTHSGAITDDDAHYLQRAQQLRQSLTPPRLSQFRVVAIIKLDNGESLLGTNDEPSPSLAGSICAERAALLQYPRRFRGASVKIDAIYIVSDASHALPPGTLCREYMLGHEATSDDTRIVLQSANPSSKPWTTTLSELYPYPSIYNKLSTCKQLDLGKSLEPLIPSLLQDYDMETMDHGQIPLTHQDLQCLWQEARQAAANDDHDDVWAIRYGAAAAVQSPSSKDLEFVTASQVKTLEYGASQDALCQLFGRLRPKKQHHVLLLLQVDQYGIPHAPFAPARSVWVEHGLGHIPVLLLNDCQSLVTVRLSQLAPFVPEFRK